MRVFSVGGDKFEFLPCCLVMHEVTVSFGGAILYVKFCYRKSQSTETLVESLKDPPPMGTHTLPHPIWYSDTLMPVTIWKLIVDKENTMCNVYNS